MKDRGLCSEALDKISAEDVRQRAKWGEQWHEASMWYVILGEEFGELGKAILEEESVDIIAEAVQVATLALKIAWMEERQARDRAEFLAARGYPEAKKKLDEFLEQAKAEEA